MSMLPEVDASHETVHVFEAAGERLFGIITSPSSQASGCAILLLGGGFMPAANRNRLWVHTARALAHRGHHVMRMDYRGVGESSGETLIYRLDTPFTQDVLAATDLLRSESGAKNLVLVGSCFGARSALAVADRIPDLAALVLLAPPGRDLTMGFQSGPLKGGHQRSWRTLIRGLGDPYERMRYRNAIRRRAARLLPRSPSRSVSPRFLRDLTAVARAGIITALVFGEDEEYLQEFRAAERGELGPLLRANENVSVHTIPGVIHGFRSLEIQDRVLGWLAEWTDQSLPSNASIPIS